MTREEAIRLLDLNREYLKNTNNIGLKDDIEALKMAIKALKQEPCEDAISRQAAKKALEDRFMELQKRHSAYRYETNFCLNTILELPSVTPQQRWIPVSERLPEDGQNVLFCDIDDDVMLGYHVKGRPNTHFTQDMIFENIKNVKAWMPLPEPYRAESEET